MQPPEGGSTGRREEEPITRGGTGVPTGLGREERARPSEGEAKAEEGQKGPSRDSGGQRDGGAGSTLCRAKSMNVRSAHWVHTWSQWDHVGGKAGSDLTGHPVAPT